MPRPDYYSLLTFSVDGLAALSSSCTHSSAAVILREVKVANKTNEGNTGEFGVVNGTI